METQSYGTLDKPRAQAAVRELLAAVGEDPDRPGLQETPARVARACEELLAGMAEDPADHLRKQFFEEGHDGMIIERDIPFASLCEHHLLPFHGRAHVAYLPKNGRITGLSKIARCVEGYARRLQVQERMTSQIADAFMEVLEPWGVLVVLEAEHMCMTARGIKKPGALTVTSAVRGTFLTDPKTRQEALSLFKA